MATGVSRKISAASARSHTRRANKSSSFQFPSGILRTTLAVLLIGVLAWAYQVLQAPAPKICGSPDGPPITAPRIKLRDGRHLAYKEHGVPKDTAKYKIIYVHGFSSCRHDAVVAKTLSPDFVKELGVYIVSFDRPGYGESDPDPNRTLKSIALDIEELADQLELGSKFYVIGTSLGGQIVWNCLKHIPHRLVGAALLAPVVNFWWPDLPANLTAEAYSQWKLHDQWALRVAHYTPWLTYWWNTQRWFPIISVISGSPDILSKQDKELVTKFMDNKENYVEQVRQQGEYESLHRDINIGFGKWEYTPLDLQNPFPNNEGSVHLWQGDEDIMVPVTLQRYIAQNLPWVHYHELSGSGHLFPHADGVSETIIKLLLGVK
ncbi:alpha/beta fold hydrolase [Medicago truncatula]|uniref:Alpha/beta fold hydrolase n=2 Tax=Medicago truncatula TaxID=3880 RepID=A0A072VKS7_MEDTR|nr:alpha/beta fold hydrolase [Medicago truncatula]